MCNICDLRVAVEEVVTAKTGIFDPKQSHVEMRQVLDAVVGVLQVGARLIAMEPNASLRSDLISRMGKGMREEVAAIREAIDRGEDPALRSIH